MRNHIILTIILFSILLAPSIPVYTSQQPFFLSDLSEENIHWQLNNLTSFLTRRAGTVECNMSAEYIYNYISSVN
ncbi:MAG: hypothetical protein QW327_03675, partial [Candidatus Odinarchaeota archaeon]